MFCKYPTYDELLAIPILYLNLPTSRQRGVAVDFSILPTPGSLLPSLAKQAVSSLSRSNSQFHGTLSILGNMGKGARYQHKLKIKLAHVSIRITKISIATLTIRIASPNSFPHPLYVRHIRSHMITLKLVCVFSEFIPVTFIC
jgi:hypothetical protein